MYFFLKPAKVLCFLLCCLSLVKPVWVAHQRLRVQVFVVQLLTFYLLPTCAQSACDELIPYRPTVNNTTTIRITAHLIFIGYYSQPHHVLHRHFTIDCNGSIVRLTLSILKISPIMFKVYFQLFTFLVCSVPFFEWFLSCTRICSCDKRDTYLYVW